MNINEFFEKTKERIEENDMYRLRPRIYCKDGTNLSVQASKYHYCIPSNDNDIYTAVEVGYPSRVPPKTWAKYFDGEFNRKNAKHSVYGYIPVELVQKWIDRHGGIDYEKSLEKYKGYLS